MGKDQTYTYKFFKERKVKQEDLIACIWRDDPSDWGLYNQEIEFYLMQSLLTCYDKVK